MCKVTGGSNYYMGRDIKTSHAGLGITESKRATDIRYMTEAMDKVRVAAREKRGVLDLVGSMKKDIVER